MARTTDKRITDDITAKSREIWYAGLGAFAKAQEEGKKVFEELAKEGEQLEKNTKKDVESAVKDVRGTVNSKVTSIRKAADERISKLENVFEERVANVLNRLGVPTSDDVKELSARVEKLSKEIRNLRTETKKAA